jgi:hypothetical protein
MQTLSGLSANSEHYTKIDFIKHYGFTSDLIEKLLKDGVLMPINSDDFTEKEASIVRLVEQFELFGLDYEIIKNYASHAKGVSNLEREVQKKLCSITTEENFSTLWKIMFETLFNAKEYVFSRHTHKVLFDVLKEEMKQKD